MSAAIIEGVLFGIVVGLGILLLISMIIGFTQYYRNSRKLNIVKAQADTLIYQLDCLQERCREADLDYEEAFMVFGDICIALLEAHHTKLMAAGRSIQFSRSALQRAQSRYVSALKRLPTDLIDDMLVAP